MGCIDHCCCRPQRGQGKAQSPAVQERQRAFQSLEASLSSQLDPIDWATYEPYLWGNVATYYQRASTLFGALLQTRRLHGQVLCNSPLLSLCALLYLDTLVSVYLCILVSCVHGCICVFCSLCIAGRGSLSC